jgi:hypothetical protein
MAQLKIFLAAAQITYVMFSVVLKDEIYLFDYNTLTRRYNM